MPPRKRPTNRDTKQDEFVKNELRKIADRFPFRDQFEKDLNHGHSDSGCDWDLGAQCSRSIAYLESSRTLDSTRFYLDMSNANYVTMLYYTCDPPRWKEAERQNQDSLEMEPLNFNALWCKCQLYLRQMAYGPVKDTLPLLDSVLEDPVAVTTAKAELGVLYADLGPAFYQRSRSLLEEAIREMESSVHREDDDVRKMRLVKWKFDLVHTYNRLMNKGCIRTYWDPSLEPSPSHADTFRRIRILVEDILSGGDPGFRGAGWVELGDAYKKYEENIPEGLRTEVLPDQMTTDDCFETAIRLAPDDVFVLERCGRHWRQRASDVDGFEKAIRLLERCVGMDPLRDVAFHHLGLAHRSIWLEKEGHEEARLHNNAVKRCGKKTKKRNCRNPNKFRNNSHRSDADMPDIFPQNVTAPSSSPVLNASRDNGEVAGSHPGRDFSRSVSANTSLENCVPHTAPTPPTYKKMNSSPARISQMLEPRYPKTPNEVPRHYRKPDYYDNLRAGNPLAKDPDHRDLLSARKYFETADKIRQGKSPRYLIDLARTYLSTDDAGKARELFLRARSTDYNCNDGVYLFEQFGLMEEKQLGRLSTDSTDVDGENGDDVDHPEVEQVKNLFRQAIQFSAEGRERSRIAFYHLRDILYRQIQNRSTSSEVLEEEHLLLYTTIQDAKKAVEILEKMKNSEAKMWNLVHLFHERNRREDQEAAFTYLRLLANAEKLKENLTEDESMYARMERVIEIGERRTTMNPDRIRETLSKIYAWLVSLGDVDTGENDQKATRKICILAPSSATPGTETVERVLSDVIGIDYVRAYLEDSPDILAGTTTHEAMEDVVRNSTAAIINMQTMDDDGDVNDGELTMQMMVKNFLNHPDYRPKRICQVVSGRCKRVPMGPFDDTLSRWDLGDGTQADLEDPKYQTNLAFSLLRAFFLSDSN